MATAATAQQPATAAPARAAERLRVYQHSDLLYWWVAWAYGLICAFLTWLQGRPVAITPGGKTVLVHPSAWVGISFVALVLFVLVFTHVRLRGVRSLVLFLVLVVLGLVVQSLYGWNEVLGYFPLLLVHMNLAFYVLFSLVLLGAWLFAIQVADRFTYWEFGPGTIARRQKFSEGGETFATPHVQTARHSDDIFVHRVLGLWFVGFGTGDLDVQFSIPGGQRTFVLKNVWQVGKIEREINRLVSKQTAPQPR
jgi:hypothetical protein